MFDATIFNQPEAQEYQTTLVGKRRRISKVSLSLQDVVAERLRNELLRKNSIVETDIAEAVSEDTTESTESAASQVLNNFDLFESIMLQLPWSGKQPDLQRQTVRAIVTTSRTCRNFHAMIASSARLQKRMFLSRDSESRRPCHCGASQEDLFCATETNPFLGPLLKKHILHNSSSCEHRRNKQSATKVARSQQRSLRRRQSRAGFLPEDHQEHDIVFRDLQSTERKHMLAFQISENDPFYLLGERTKPDASWRNMFLTNPAPTRIEIYYWSYLIRAETREEGLTAGSVWETVDKTLQVARQRKVPGYQYEGHEPLLVLVGTWPGDDQQRHVFDWLNQRYEACKSPTCRYSRS